MNPLSKSKIKYIKSLQLKKNRVHEGRFIVEGGKSVTEFLKSDFTVVALVATAEFYAKTNAGLYPADCYVTGADTLATLGTFKSNNTALAIVATCPATEPLPGQDEFILAVDGLNDPGNLGTIIRIADWFGIRKVLLSNGSVEVYNPKVVSATKGSLTRVAVYYVDLPTVLATYPGQVYAAAMAGEDLANVEPVRAGVLVLGSESHGISAALSPYITRNLTIPRQGGAESLNVAVAAGIICYHLLQ